MIECLCGLRGAEDTIEFASFLFDETQRSLLVREMGYKGVKFRTIEHLTKTKCELERLFEDGIFENLSEEVYVKLMMVADVNQGVRAVVNRIVKQFSYD